MKRKVLLTVTGVMASLLLATCPLAAQTASSGNEIDGLAQIEELIKTNPANAEAGIEQFLKGKNKKDARVLAAIGGAYLSANKMDKAKEYDEIAKKADSKSPYVSMLEGDIALVEKNVGLACQKYEEAIYFDPNCKEAYLKYAEVYKGVNPKSAIEKLEELKKLDASYIPADQALANVYYSNNQFDKAIEAYSKFIDSPQADEADVAKYAFALFLNHNFDKSLEVAQKGLARNPRNAAFNRLAMYNCADLKRYDEGIQAADKFFNASDNPDFAYLDYVYYGHLLNFTKQYDAAIAQFQKAMEVDSTKADLWREISGAYESKGDFSKAIDNYEKFYGGLSADKQTADLELQLGKLYYENGTSTDSLTLTKEMKEASLAHADTVFMDIASKVPDNYLGNFWRARVNSALDPETTKGMAKPFYETVISMLTAKNDPHYNTVLVECYSYLGYYYLVANKIPESTEYWNKILEISPDNATAAKALDGIKKIKGAKTTKPAKG